MSRLFAVSTLVAGLLASATVTPVAAEAGAGLYPQRVGFLLDGWNRSSSMVVADIDADGANEFVFGHQDGRLRAYEADGTLKWSTAAVPGIGPGCHAQGSASAIDSSPAVADLDGDGNPEVIVGVGSTWAPNQNGSVIAFDGRTGAIEWSFAGGRDMGNVWVNTGSPDGWCEGVFSTPSIGDVDGDGNLDVVFASWDFHIWAVDRFGVPLTGFPVNNDDSVWSSAALFDLDGDGDKEIFIGGDSSLGGYFDHQGGVFRALDWKGGVVTELWHRTTNEVIHSSPAIGDINGDGRPEAIVGTGDNWQSATGTATDHTKVFAFHLDDGSTVPGWPVSTGGTVITNPALGDLDGDGTPEVVVGSWDHTVRAWRGNGSSYWTARPQFNHFGSSRITGSPIIVDLDGDGDQDVAVGTEVGLALLDGRNGALLEAGLGWQDRVSISWSHESTPAVGTLGGERRLIFTAFDTPGTRTRVASFALPPTTSVDAWPMQGHSPARAGAPIGSLCAMTGASGTFCDVPDTVYFAAAVKWMVNAAITQGISDNLYGPDQSLTRGQMVTFLWREAGKPTGYPAHGFGDVAAGEFFNEAVKWAKALGITKGTGPQTFSPHAVVNRAQLVTLLWRRAGSPRGYPNPGFVDVPLGEFFTQAVWWAKATGVTTGTTATTFEPSAAVTRGQAAAFLHREATKP